MPIRLVQRGFTALREALARALVAAGVKPNAVTLFGTALSAVVGVLWAFGFFRTGALVLIAAAFADMLDGAVARRADSKTPFGAFLDSTMDRVSDCFLFMGPIVYYMRRGGCEGVAALGVVALAGSLLVSYTRARAESVAASPTVGLWERPERVVAVILGGFWAWGTPAEPQMATVLLLIAVGAPVTVVQRILYTRRLLAAADPRAKPALGRAGRFLLWDYDRSERIYQVTVVLLILTCSFAPARWVLAALQAALGAGPGGFR